MHYAPRPKLSYDLRDLTDVQLNRLYCRIWDHIERRYGPGSWDLNTLWAVYPGFAAAIVACRVEALRRLHS